MYTDFLKDMQERRSVGFNDVFYLYLFVYAKIDHASKM